MPPSRCCSPRFLVGEFVADQQQWDFHRAKAAAGGRLEPGFVTTGLFRVQPSPELLLRAGAVVGVLRDRRDRGGGIRSGPVGRSAQLDDPRRRPAERSCSSGRRSSPSRSPRRSTPPTPTTSGATSMLVPLPRAAREARQGCACGEAREGAERREGAAAGLRASRPLRLSLRRSRTRRGCCDCQFQ